MKAHVIENGVVVNTIEVESLDFLPNLVEATEGGIGWSYADGVFTAPVVVVSDEDAAEQVRSRRDQLLTKSDWMAVKSYETGEPIPTEWATYRQALRDITAQDGFPHNVIWPEVQ